MTVGLRPNIQYAHRAYTYAALRATYNTYMCWYVRATCARATARPPAACGGGYAAPAIYMCCSYAVRATGQGHYPALALLMLLVMPADPGVQARDHEQQTNEPVGQRQHSQTVCVVCASRCGTQDDLRHAQTGSMVISSSNTGLTASPVAVQATG